MAQGFGSLGGSFGGPRRSRRRRKRSAVRRCLAAAFGATAAVAVLLGVEGWGDRADAVRDGFGVLSTQLWAPGQARDDAAAPTADAAQDLARRAAVTLQEPDDVAGRDPVASALSGDAPAPAAPVQDGEDAPVATAPSTEPAPPIANGTEGTSVGHWTAAAHMPPPAAAANPTPTGARVFLQLSSFNDKKRADRAAAALSRSAADALGGAVLQVVRGSVNDRPVWRVRAGPLADPAEARALCASLRSQDRDCLVVRS